MAEIRDNVRYLPSHEWARLEADGTVTIGISDHAQDALGDVVFVELPEVGRAVQAGEEVAVVESVKAASDIYAPVAGTIIGCNDTLESAPETVNDAPYDGGWFYKLQPADANNMNELLTPEAYRALCAADDH
ncbi:MAG: glycine cleavage system protein GcvH [Pseudomonadales bacterium]|jgi:glycine cleavage system H protein|tara:strand:+ start:3006 stop:3401 length:396 start_codon:yes stop_codon:yes gene_type:complete